MARHQYTQEVRLALDAALRLRACPSQEQERVMVEDGGPPEHILPSVMVVRREFASQFSKAAASAAALSSPPAAGSRAALCSHPITSPTSGADAASPHSPCGSSSDAEERGQGTAAAGSGRSTPAGGSGGERCFIEPSLNSVRVSFRLMQADALDGALVGLYMRLLMQRADQLGIIRRIPLPGYDVSFLITSRHVAAMTSAALVHILAAFVEESQLQVSDLKLAVNARGRAVATQLLGTLAF